MCLSFAIETKNYCSKPPTQYIERHVSSIANVVQLAKTKVITHLLTYATAFSARNFHVMQCKSLEIQTCSMGVLKTKTPKTPKDPQRPQNLKTKTPHIFRGSEIMTSRSPVGL